MNKYCAALEDIRRRPTHKLKEIGDQWRTPDSLFWGINAMFGPLVLDLFADESNAKCEAYYTAENNALAQDWSARLVGLNGAAFGNPPYSRASQHDGQYITGMVHIMEHTMAMRELGGRYIVLIKAATSETWWPEQADHIAFIRGRIGFDVPAWFNPADDKQVPTGAFFAGAIAVFDKTWTGPAMGYVNRDDLITRGETALAQMRWMAPRLGQPQIALQNIPESVPRPVAVNLPQSKPVSELPTRQQDILDMSGVVVWACVRAAFGDEPEYTFSQSKYAHTWAADSLESPEIITALPDTIDRAKKLIKEHQDTNALAQWLDVQQVENATVRADLFERLQRVADEAWQEYGLEIKDFIQAMESMDKAKWLNIRIIRSHLRQYLESRTNRVWPTEVHFLFDQVPAAGSLPAELQNKIRSHINRMKLDGMATDAIIQQTVKLTAAMGATA